MLEVARFDAPETDDPQAWAALTVDLSRAGRSVSSELRKASIETTSTKRFSTARFRDSTGSHRYAGREEAKRNRARREGFGGIGIRFQVQDTGIVVTEVMEETPAEEAESRGGGSDRRGRRHPGPGPDVEPGRAGPARTGRHQRHARRCDGYGDSKSRAFTLARRPTSYRRAFATASRTVYWSSRFPVSIRRRPTNLSRKTKAAFREHGANLRGIVLDLRGNPGGLLKQAIRAAEPVPDAGRDPALPTAATTDSLQFYEAGGAERSPRAFR